MTKHRNRREFIAAAALAGGAAVLSTGTSPAAESAFFPPDAGTSGISSVCVFSKHLQWLDYREMAVFAREAGFDGIDLTVRPGGHVEPEEVEKSLPEAVKAIRNEGLEVPMMTSAVNDPELGLSRRVLEAAAGQGIKYYRMGYYQFVPGTAVAETLDEVRKKMAGLARLNESLGIRGSYQNHAGNGYFGASIWDLWNALNDLPAEWIGSQFDLRHAMVESTLNWKTNLRLISGRVNTLAVKDSSWAAGNGRQLQAEYCPLGKGFSDFPSLLEILASNSFNGPASLHFEYPLGGAEHGGRELSIKKEYVKAAMKRDLASFRKILNN